MKKILVLALAMIFAFNTVTYCGPFDFIANLFGKKEPEVKTEIVEKEVIIKETENRKAIEESIRRELEKEYNTKNDIEVVEGAEVVSEEVNKLEEKVETRIEKKPVRNKYGFTSNSKNKRTAFKNIELKNDTIAINMATGEQIDTTYIPFWVEEGKWVSLDLAEYIVNQNPDASYKKPGYNLEGSVDQILESIENAREKYNFAVFKGTDAFGIKFFNDHNPVYITKDELKVYQNELGANEQFNEYDPEKLKNKLISFELAEKLVKSDKIDIIANWKVDEWKENGMKSCKFDRDYYGKITFSPSSKEPEITE